MDSAASPGVAAGDRDVLAASTRLRVRKDAPCLKLLVRFADLRRPWTSDLREGPRPVELYAAGSTVVKIARVACGDFDAYASPYLRPYEWDVCAGDLVVCEAGGAFTDLEGHRHAYNAQDLRRRKGTLASNGQCHEELRRRILKALGEDSC